MRRIIRLLLPTALCAMAGCASLKIATPGTNTTVPEPVSVTVHTNADIAPQSVSAMLDGVDVSTLFTIDPGSRSLSARLPMSLGMHTLQVEARLWNGLYRRYDPYRDSASFTAALGGGLTLQLPAALSVAPGQTGTLTVGVARSGAFQGDVSVALFVPTNSSSVSTTIPAAASSGSVATPIGTAALPREETVRVFANGPLYDSTVGDSKTFTFRVAHRPGALQRAALAARIPFQTATGPDGSTQVHIGNGAAATYDARFVKGSTILGTVIGFNPGPAGNEFGGAGFCQAGGVGFVLSATGPGVTGTSDAVLFVRYFDDAGIAARLDVATSRPAAPFVRPSVLFSTVCGIVIAIGANADASSPKNHLAVVHDVFRSKEVCRVAFSDPPANLQATVLSPAAGNQTVQITVDGTMTPCPVF